MDDYQKNGYQNGYGNGWGPQGQGYYQQNYYQNGYYQDPRRNRFSQELEEPMTLGEWIVTLLISVIPCVNVIMMFEWAFGSSTKRSKSNWAKAMLIFLLIFVIIGVILMITGVFTMTEYYTYLYNNWY